jgi:hypothetical protein
MSVDEAFEVLGVSRDATKDAVRRAYLRGVRAHPPERDPDGFQRIREAYDLLSMMMPIWQTEREGDVSLAAPAMALAPLATAPGPAAEDASPSDDQRAPPVELESFEAFENFAEWGLTDEQRRVHRAIHDEDWKTAFDLLVTFYESPPRPDQPVPSASDTLKVVLELFRTNKPNRATKLFRAFDDFANRNASWAGRVTPQVAARWSLLRELDALRGVVPDELLASFADAIEDDEFTAVAVDVGRWVDAGGSLAPIKKAAPALHTIVSANLPDGTVKSRQTSAFVGWGIRAAIMFSLLRGCSAVAEHTRDRSTTVLPPAVQTTAQAAPPSLDGTAQGKDTPRVGLAPRDAEALIRDAVIAGDCEYLRDAFPLYAAQPGTDPESRLLLKIRAKSMCPELRETLSP